MGLIFRKIDQNCADDIDQFNQLMDQLSTRAQDTARLIEGVARLNAKDDAYLMVAEDRETGRLCGSLLALLLEDLCGQCQMVMLIENVVVRQGFQRRGVGRKMFEEIESWGKARGIHYAMLCSGLERTGAHGFYAAIGYQEVKGFKKYF